MAGKTKTTAVATVPTNTGSEKAPRLKKDGTPWKSTKGIPRGARQEAFRVQGAEFAKAYMEAVDAGMTVSEFCSKYHVNGDSGAAHVSLAGKLKSINDSLAKQGYPALPSLANSGTRTGGAPAAFAKLLREREERKAAEAAQG